MRLQGGSESNRCLPGRLVLPASAGGQAVPGVTPGS